MVYCTRLFVFFSIGTIFYGAVIYFTYKKINHQEVTISQSLQKAIEKFSENLILQLFNNLLLAIFFLVYSVRSI